MDLGIGTAGIEEYNVEGQAESTIFIANIEEGELCTWGNAVCHAVAVGSLSCNSSSDVSAVSILVVVVIHERCVLYNFSGPPIHSPLCRREKFKVCKTFATRGTSK